MSTTYPDPLGRLSRPGLGGQSFKIRADSPAGIQFCRLSFRPLSRCSQTHSGEVDSSVTETQPSVGTRDLLGQAVHAPNRASDSHTKTGGVGTTSYETHSLAFKETLACPGSRGKAHSPAKVSPRSSAVVVGPKQCSERSTTTLQYVTPSSCLQMPQTKAVAHTWEITLQKASGPSQEVPCTYTL